MSLVYMYMHDKITIVDQFYEINLIVKYPFLRFEAPESDRPQNSIIRLFASKLSGNIHSTDVKNTQSVHVLCVCNI
jgi:hypothetical protein